ncbi:MAG: hypothetical protein H0T42_17780 [Deltaproteobacteria bacterium]|nr:hypothetical protein [Deltaproteobacteria bacterium]
MRTFVLVSVIALAGCGSKKEPATRTDTGSGSAGSGSAVAKPTVGPETSAPKANNLALPKGDGTPPKQSAKALDQAAFEKLAKHELPGFTPIVRNVKNQLDVRHVTQRPVLATTVTIAPCFDCLPMELDKWKAKEAGLKMLLVEELRDRPDTIWELGTTELHGQPLIFTYQFGYSFGKDDQGNPEGAFSNAYALYFSDGKNQIRVVAEYKDDPVTKEDLKAIAPREDLEKLAKGFLDFYTHAW